MARFVLFAEDSASALSLIGMYPQLHISYIIHATAIDLVLAEIDLYNPPPVNRTHLHIYAIGSRTPSDSTALIDGLRAELKILMDEFALGNYNCNCGLKLPRPTFVICDVSSESHSLMI